MSNKEECNHEGHVFRTRFSDLKSLYFCNSCVCYLKHRNGVLTVSSGPLRTKVIPDSDFTDAGWVRVSV